MSQQQQRGWQHLMLVCWLAVGMKHAIWPLLLIPLNSKAAHSYVPERGEECQAPEQSETTLGDNICYNKAENGFRIRHRRNQDHLPSSAYYCSCTFSCQISLLMSHYDLAQDKVVYLWDVQRCEWAHLVEKEGRNSWQKKLQPNLAPAAVCHWLIISCCSSGFVILSENHSHCLESRETMCCYHMQQSTKLIKLCSVPTSAKALLGCQKQSRANFSAHVL